MPLNNNLIVQTFEWFSKLLFIDAHQQFEGIIQCPNSEHMVFVHVANNIGTLQNVKILKYVLRFVNLMKYYLFLFLYKDGAKLEEC